MKRKALFVALIVVAALLLVGVITAYQFWQQQTQNNQIPEVIPPNEALISGQVIHKSDVQTIPDTPATEGTILAFSSDNFQQFLAEAKLEEDYNESNLWRIQAGVSDEIVSKYKVASSPLDSEGRFSMSTEAGNYFICLTNSGKFPVEADWVFVGCKEVQVQEGQKTDLDITSVFGGIR